MKPLSDIAYGAGAGAKLAFYAAHYGLSRAISAPLSPEATQSRHSVRTQIDPRAVRRVFLDVFAQDRRNIQDGLYLPPSARQALAQARQSLAYLRDLDALDQRRLARAGTEVRDHPQSAIFPTYYRQNFHWQSGGWLTAESANIYDFQVETLFTGAAAAMRRTTALALLSQSLKGCDQRALLSADIGCGTGQFGAEVLRNFPRLGWIGCDMSPAYAAKTATALQSWAQASAISAAAEALPFGDASLDRAVCIYVFHELPPKIRGQVVQEMARVTKKGGVLVLADALQAGDDPNLNPMLDAFPQGFHEPYFTSWLDTDIVALFEANGFALQQTRRAFLTKAWAFERL